MRVNTFTKKFQISKRVHLTIVDIMGTCASLATAYSLAHLGISILYFFKALVEGGMGKTA